MHFGPDAPPPGMRRRPDPLPVNPWAIEEPKVGWVGDSRHRMSDPGRPPVSNNHISHVMGLLSDAGFHASFGALRM